MAKKIELSKQEKKALEKEAQGLLSSANKLLREAGQKAELGGFSLSFLDHDYIPVSVYGKESLYWDDMDSDQKGRAVGLLGPDESTEGWDDEKLEDFDSKVEDARYEENFPEVSQPGKWYQWIPSTC